MHTPWKVSDLDFRVVVDAQDMVVADVRVLDRAVSNLLAAAPDMLEALRGVLANCDLRNAALSSVKRAIAKAEGKSK